MDQGNGGDAERVSLHCSRISHVVARCVTSYNIQNVFYYVPLQSKHKLSNAILIPTVNTDILRQGHVTECLQNLYYTAHGVITKEKHLEILTVYTTVSIEKMENNKLQTM